jgi:leucyl aminopeptidase
VSSSLAVVIDAGQLERAAADVAVATFFESDRPLRGDAGRADWRLCGLLSRLVASPHLSGRSGEAALVHTGGKLRAPRLMLLGLGAPAAFSALEVKAAARDAVLRALELRADTVALSLPGHWTGVLPVTPTAAAVLRGAATALAEANASIRLRLVVPAGSASKALSGLDAMAQQLADGTVSIRISAEDPSATFAPREFAARELQVSSAATDR